MGFTGFGFCLILLVVQCPFVYGAVVSHDRRAITIDGQRKIFLSGSIHYPRSTPEMWPDLIRKAKEGGLDTIETYVFWNVHEPSRREYDFSGNLDLIRFIRTIQSEGLYAVLRIGPYVCAEWTYGGFPMWLHNIKDIKFRTMNQAFMNEVQNFTTFIVDMVKKEKLFASQGGPIILAQIENEYGNIMKPYGEPGKEYVKWNAKMADSLNIGVPWIMCQQDDAPEPMLKTCNGFYCDKYKHPDNTPKMWTENWTGWFKPWGGATPHRTAEDVAFSVARFFQYEGTFQNYYMYHGGTNFGRTSGGPYLTTSYDYDAPLNEYGNLNQPKYGHLKQLHNVLKSMEKTLTYGNITYTEMGNGVTVTKYATQEISSCFIGNGNDKNDATIDFEGTQYNIPAWSVSILPDCKIEVYNTAKVNTQTSITVKRADNKPANSLQWSWRPEKTNETVILGKGDYKLNQLVDQKVFGDTSDYLWYMTSVNIKGKDKLIMESSNTSIRVNGTAHVFHVYVNGEYIGAQWGPYKVWEKQVKLKPGKNIISLLSATVGYANYGEFFDEIRAGILGPVQLVARTVENEEIIIKDLATNKWNYRVGLDGFDDELFSKDSRFASQWQQNNLPTNTTMVWYKTTFTAPLGSDTVVVDLKGMGKGEAWVNGKSLGRYWPSFIADKKFCSNQPCDYRGEYHSEKCAKDCEQPSQRWYHVPRSFLTSNENTLVLFEEFGGDVSEVSFQTVSTGTVCGSAYENNKMELSCEGREIIAINFASFGDAQGICGSFQKGSCEGRNDALSIVQKECVGKESCSVQASVDVFGSTSCKGTKRLVVQAVC